MNYLREHIRSIVIIILVIITAVFVKTYYDGWSHNTPPGEPGPIGPPPQDPASQRYEVSGTVMAYAANPDGDIDKIAIETDGNRRWLHFPPHTARDVMAIAALNTLVKIAYRERPGKKGKTGSELETISYENKTLDIQSILPPPPATGKNGSITGNKVSFRKDENGRVAAFIVDGRLIRLPPHTGTNLIALLEKAKSISVKGNERSNEDGFVNAEGLRLFRADEIKIDSVNYLLR